MRFTLVHRCGRAEQLSRGCAQPVATRRKTWPTSGGTVKENKQYAHIRKKAPQHANEEDVQRYEMLDTQLLNWGKDNRTNEVAAVAAAEELRSKVEGCTQ